MKRITFAVALVAALLISATAFAATTTYNGSVSTGTIGFKVKAGKHGDKVLRELFFNNVPIKCKAGKNTVSGVDQLDSLPVKNSSFTIKLKATDPQFDAKLVFKGTLHGPAASGTFHLTGKKVPLDDSSIGKDCDTGVLKWNASSN
jgi:hypothetical protein